ncbi:MAG: hypothetical protein KIT81_02900 [Alphaproteobacteria bacterium]|nr:hypothetical protein [Alphaproteobacteria bacterium]
MNTRADALAAARERERALVDLLALVERIRQLMTEEMEVLDRQRPRELERLVQQKNELLAAYRSRLALLRAGMDMPDQGNPALLAELKAAAGALAELAEREQGKLARLRTINEGIVKAVGEQLARRSAPVQGYGKDGVMRTITPNPRLNSRPASVVVNQAV